MKIVKTHPSVIGLMNRLLYAFENQAFARYSDWGGAERLAEKQWEKAFASQTIFTKEDVYSEYESRHPGVFIAR